MKISNKGTDLIKFFEGFKGMAYKPYPTETYYTIGYGHYSSNVAKGDLISKSEAENLLKNDLIPIELKLNKLIENGEISVNQNEFDALCSFIFNVGLGAFEKSTMLKKLKLKDNESVAYEFPKWVYVSGVQSKGLSNRRTAESKLFRGQEWQN